MLRLRPYKTSDADVIASWTKDEYALRQWSADRYRHYPLRAKDINEQYAEMIDEDWFYPFTAFDEKGIVGHLVMRFLDEEKEVLRFGFIIIDDTKRGRGLGKEMLRLSLKYAFEILGAKKVRLGVFQNNTGAYRSYKAVGFKESNIADPESFYVFGEEWKQIELEMDWMDWYKE
ncbi:MAG: GNAT family protein [Johnsonella sp.]|nr:GNAT family protein [Johnsonella sp.]